MKTTQVTSVIMHHSGVSLSKQQTDLSWTKLNLSHIIRARLSQQPEQLLSVWLQMHVLSFTLKSWAESLVFIGAVSLCIALISVERLQPQSWSKFVLPVGSLPLMICSRTYKWEVSCHVCFNFSRLCSRSPMLHSGNSPLPTECVSSIFVILI